MHGTKHITYSPYLRSRLTVHSYRCIRNAGMSYSCSYLVNGEIDHARMLRARARACVVCVCLCARVNVTEGGRVVRISPVSKAKCASCSIVMLAFSSASALTQQRTQPITFTQTNHSDMLSMCMGLHINCAVFLSDFKQNKDIVTNF